MKAVLIYPPIPHVTTTTAPPVGLAYLASVLIEKGFDPKVVSSDAEGLDAEATVSRVLSLSPDLVLLSVTTPTTNNSLKMIRRLKKEKPDAKILAGGPHPTLFPEEFLSAGADYVCRGEGEITLSELCDYFSGQGPIESIRGLSFRRDGQAVHNPERDLIQDLDKIPFPKWELFPVENYKSEFRKHAFTMPVVSSRGCPARCTFCYKGIFGCAFRVRSPANIVAEIEHLKALFKIEEFAIIDDSFTSIPKRAMEVCDLIVARKIGLPWSLPAGIRVPTVSAELLKKLKAAGCYRVGLGIESGNPEILKSIQKGITMDQVRNAVKLLKQTGIESAGYFMIGNLEETLETVDQTIRFALELDCDYSQFTKCTPYPGTAIYEQLMKENRIVAASWDDYDSFLKSRPIFTHKNLTSEQIDGKLREAYRRLYYRPGYIMKHLKAIRSRAELVKLIKYGFKFLTSYSS